MLSYVLFSVDAQSLASVPAGDVAHGLAWSYYYGYLKLVLPAIPDRNKGKNLPW